MKFIKWLPVLFLSGCLEQRAMKQFEATVTRVCVTAPTAQSIDHHLHTHVQGCVLVAVEKSTGTGLDHTGMAPGVYRTQASNLGFAHYLDEVIIARAADTLAVMTPAAFQVLVEAAGKVQEARVEEEYARAGLGVVLLGSLQTFAAADLQPLTSGQLISLRKIL